ncbi:85/88 kDa calcium-independent phospholipase A2 isoform X1 [Anopheles ziemanni]|uniref:85/88 kDa calcium-independent phospholipase A2 isoform X2 n=1 Tax=Anopheles coustani TaxID=139045 RepID=UPI00265B5BB6|nr:85/88 kDa calcium-independent phospholipase A2 isoform X2 [Anopheles coustani]XP_058168303.1 85/88 kDa calcium-independent phospholipase A2 isoform X1 [Anopheles ziemanni]
MEMAWLGIGALASGLALQRFLGGDAPPNKVQEVKNESYVNLPVLQRNETMRLFAPNPNAADKKPVYEIILERPHSETLNTSYSLYRAPTQAAAEEKFEAFHQRLPELVKIVREMYNINGLQKLCDTLIENPSWSLAHVVAFYNLTDYISNPSIIDFLDYAEYSDMLTPLQVAVKANNIEFAKALVVSNYCNLDHLDKNSNSVFHYAASTTKEMINLLTAKSISNLNHCNTDGYTPLHLACLADKPDCVKALLLAGADTNKMARSAGNAYNKAIPTSNVADFLVSNPNKLFTQDMKHGGTPLHWSSSREVLNSLIERGCDVNLVNFNGQTPLHVMVARDRLECVVALLAHEAEIDVVDNSGNTPLHIAVEKKLIPIVQCLVVFGADLNKPNKDGKTPRHMVGKDDNGSKEAMILYILHSVGAKRCPEKGSGSGRCPPGCAANGSYNGIPPAQPETSEQREHIQQVLACTSNSKSHRNSVPSLISNTIRASIPEERERSQPKTVDVSQERKGASMMDALLSMFTNKVEAVSKPTSPSASYSSLKGGVANLLGDFDIGDEPMLTDDASASSVAGEPAKTPDGAESSKHHHQQQRSSSDAGSIGAGQHTYAGRGRLLCLDGGGIRGLVLAQMLLEIENLSGTPIVHLFDWVAGTSTGGILALALGVGKTMKQCMCLYLRMKDQAFVGMRPYPSDLLESVLKDQLGEFTVMTDIKHPRLMVTGVMADRKPVDLHLFRNYECASDIMGIVTPSSNRREPPPPPCEQLVWRAARATGAAPSYFRAYGRFLDGGLIANNPTLDAMTEIHELNAALHYTGRSAEVVPVSVVVSLGTGLAPVVDLKEIDVFRPGGIWDTAKLAYGISTITTLLVDQATASDGRVIDRARAWCSMIGVPYFRFNPQLSVDIAMDEKIDEPLINMLWEVKAYMHSNRKQVIELINLLK